MSKPKNKGIKWVGSFNPITNDINIIILSTNTHDITIKLPCKGIVKVKMVTTTGNKEFCKTKHNKFNDNTICIRQRSLTSLRYKI